MAVIRISKPYTMSRHDVRQAAEELARELKSQYGLGYTWKGETHATFRRSGLDGSLDISDDSIDLKIKLGLMASAFERPLKQAITDYLDQYVS